MIQASCPHCGYLFRIAEEQAGMAVACKRCGMSFLTLADVPSAAESPPDVKLDQPAPPAPAAGAAPPAPPAPSAAPGELDIQLGQARAVEAADTTEISLRPSPPSRCPECGGLIQMGVCMICGRDIVAARGRRVLLILLLVAVPAASAVFFLFLWWYSQGRGP